MAVGVQQGQRVGGQAQVEQRPIGAGPTQHFGVEGAGQAQPAALARRLAGPQVGQHLVARQQPLDQQLDRTACRLLAEQPRLDDAGVVEDQQVAGDSSEGSSRNGRSTGSGPRPSSSARRCVRAGCCAISSGGSTKSKSSTV
jgi:hypothetical protein